MAAGRHRLWLIGGLVFLFLGLLAAFLSAPPALATPSHDVGAATTVYVDTTDDETTNDTICSLREALQQQIPNCIGNSISLLPTTYVLTDTGRGALTVASSANLNITVNGGSAIIQGQPGWSTSILSINANSVVAISDVTIRNGNASSGGIGGGIYNLGVLSLTRCQILSNTAPSAGGGIFNFGTLLMSDTLVMSNTVPGDVSLSPSGGGVYNNGKLTVSNSTLSNNATPQGRGGGLFVDQNASETVLKNVTMSHNMAADGGGLYYASQSSTPGGLSYGTVYSNTAAIEGGGVFGSGSGIVLTSTIVAGNAAVFNRDCSGSVASNGYNLTQTDCSFSEQGDLIDDPLLGPLQNNGGPTLTHALADTSPALNRIPYGTKGCGTTFTTDQRGEDRPDSPDGKCDIGAFELVTPLDKKVYLPLVLR